MMSAAEPWIGALMAWRSTPARSFGLPRFDLRIMADAAEQGRHVAVFARSLLDVVHVGANAGEALEILLDERRRLPVRDARGAAARPKAEMP